MATPLLSRVLASKRFLPALAVGGVVMLLLIGGVFMLSAAGKQDALVTGDRWYSLRVYVAQALLGLGVLSIVATIPMPWLRKNAQLLFVFGLLAAVLPFIPQVGIRAGGASREVALGPLRWEPGLVLAMLLSIWAASILARRPLGKARRFAAVFAVALAIGLALAQPDFSLVPLILVPVALQALRAGLEGRRAIALGLVLGSLVAGSTLLHPYIAKRVEGWLHPKKTAHFVGRDYLLLQQGFHHGGTFGAGYGEGRYVVQTGNAKSDYFFGHVIEELGWLRAGGVLLLYVPILGLGLHVAKRARDRFTALLGTGMASFILTAAAMHIAVSTRMVPVTAIHLPFLSYGGTSLVTSVVAFGLLLAAHRSLQDGSAVGQDEETSPSGGGTFTPVA